MAGGGSRVSESHVSLLDGELDAEDGGQEGAGDREDGAFRPGHVQAPGHVSAWSGSSQWGTGPELGEGSDPKVKCDAVDCGKDPGHSHHREASRGQATSRKMPGTCRTRMC